MIVFNIILLSFLYRRIGPLLILMVSLALSIGAMVACLKLFGITLNLFNVLAFPLVLGVGVDYGIYILLALRQPGDKQYAFATIIKPVILAGLTAMAGFGSLAIAQNPALRGLGIVCAIGIACCLFSTIFFILPAYLVGLKRMTGNPWYRLNTFRAALRLASALPRDIVQEIAGRHRPFRLPLCAKRPRGRPGKPRPHHRPPRRDARRALPAKLRHFLRMMADYFYCSARPRRRNPRPGRAPGRALNTSPPRANEGKGGILVTAHLGNWELGGIILALAGVPLTVVTLEEPTSELTEWREAGRRRLGIKTIAIGSDPFSFVGIVSALRRNEFVAMLVDRPYGDSSVPVQFFGAETQFSSAPSLLHGHTGAAVIPAFVLQKPGGRYVSVLEPPVPMSTESPESNAQKIAAVFEAVVRRYPDQWFNYVPIWK